jgi:hypothetical protein
MGVGWNDGDQDTGTVIAFRIREGSALRRSTMTNRGSRFALAASAACGFGASQGLAQDVLWSEDFGGSEQDGAWAIEATADGGFVAAGFTESFSPNSFSAAYLVKTDAEGDEQWSRTYELTDDENIAAAVREVPGGGYAIAGRTGTNGGFDSFLIRTDPEGNVLWERTYDAGDDDRAHALATTSDGGFILAGQAWLGDFIFGSYDYYVVKTDADGNVEWTRTFEYDDNFAPGADVALGVEEVSTGGYVIVGATNTIVWDGWLIRTDELGQVIWDRTYGQGSSDEMASVRELADGGFVLGGSFATPQGDVDVAMVRTDELGTPLWQRTFGVAGKDDQGQCVRVLPDGGFVLVGYTSSFGAGGWDLYVARTDAAGTTLWTDVQGGNSDDRAHSVAVGKTRIAVAGWAWSFGAGQGDVHVVAYDDPALGCTADFDGDGTLSILDFIAFQNAFTSGDPGADCDGNGTLNILDFVCFQTVFQAGC